MRAFRATVKMGKCIPIHLKTFELNSQNIKQAIAKHVKMGNSQDKKLKEDI